MSVSMISSITLFLFIAFVGSASAQDCPVENVCFALDESASVGDDWDNVATFAKETAEKLWTRTSPTLTAWAFAEASQQIAVPSGVGWFGTQVTQHDSIKGSTTNMYAGIQSCFEFLKDKSGKKAVVLVTDGIDLGSPSALDYVNMNMGYGIGIITVGIGKNIRPDYLRDIASKDEDGNPLYISTSMASLTDKAQEASDNICVAVGGEEDNCLAAYNACDFRFEGYNSPPNFWCCGRADSTLGGKIVSRSGPQIGVVNSNGIVPEFINPDGTMDLITSVGNPRFTPTHFKPYPLRHTRFASSVGHQAYSGNQRRLAKGKCVRVWISTYQEITGGRRPRVTKNVNVDKGDNKCVVFRMD